MVFRGTKKGDRAAHASGGGCRRPAGEGPRGEGRVAIRDPCRICCARSDSKWRLAAAVFRNIARLGDTPRRAFPYYSGRTKLETFLGAALPPSSFQRQPRSSRKAVAPRADRLLRGGICRERVVSTGKNHLQAGTTSMGPASVSMRSSSLSVTMVPSLMPVASMAATREHPPVRGCAGTPWTPSPG